MRKRFCTALLGCLLLVFTAACGSGGTSTVKLAEVTRSLFYAPQYVAIEKGFFEEQGIDIKLQTAWGGDKTMTALLSDGADIALVGSETSIYVQARGSKDKVINFAQLTQTDGTFLVAKEPNPNFEWQDLKNTTFLGQRVGGMPQMAGEYVLKKHDINPETDLNLIQNVDFANIPGAFASGDAQYVQLFEPTASTFEKEGKGHIVASFGKESGHVPYTTFMTKESFMTNNEKTVKNFTKAVHKAQKWVQEHSAKEIAKVIQPYFEDTELEILASSVDRYKSQGSFALDPILDKDEWNNLKDIMDEAGELPEDVPYKTLVNTQIAEEVIGD
ncbi:ABC transporter substrate-binding protein [Lentibacillus cibarius]|uniref:ABC transporter substrate-binding protein n=1 Tax=Lentibacillus cibarius TaxID=2583219 RepID=A0A5S3QH97_9BACI|nr:ABC transporter substrate-binding protein [Lentibacillus cibarius]TMN21228.1 ABC transporter substrate-binding protein [Lentibacillus cibarius]